MGWGVGVWGCYRRDTGCNCKSNRNPRPPHPPPPTHGRLLISCGMHSGPVDVSRVRLTLRRFTRSRKTTTKQSPAAWPHPSTPPPSALKVEPRRPLQVTSQQGGDLAPSDPRSRLRRTLISLHLEESQHHPAAPHDAGKTDGGFAR